MASTLTDLDAGSRHNRGVWTRRAVIAVFCLIAGLALADVFGQKTSHSKAGGPAAQMELAAPEVVRGGLFFQSQPEIRARRKIDFPRIVARGRVLESNLRKQRMTMQELLAEARLQSIADLDDVDYAVLETNGRVSFLKQGDG